MSIITRRGILQDGIGREYVRSSYGGRRKILSDWIGDLADSTTQTVATKAALKALDTSLGYASVFVQGRTSAGDGGGGLFRWSSSNNSANVTADTLEGIYIAPDSDTDGSSGAWVRADVNFILPEWFGGKADNSTDNATVFTATETMADRLDKRLVWWLGENYRFNSTVTATKDSIHHEGAGARQTAWTFNHTNDGVQIGTSALHVRDNRFDGIRYLQASGSGYAFNYYNGRNLQIIDAAGSSVRNWMKVGSQFIAVSGAVNNGSGLIRLTLASDAFATGDIVYVNAVGGVSAATGQWTLTRISSGVYDLQGSTFAGAYTSGGRVAPHVTQLTHEWDGNSITTNATYAFDIYSISGTVRFGGKPLWENGNTSSAIPVDGTIWMNIRRATTVYDRLDWIEGATGGRLYDISIKIDNTRVVAIEITRGHFDGPKTAFLHVDLSNADATGGGFGDWRFPGYTRVGADGTHCKQLVKITMGAGTGDLLFFDRLNASGVFPSDAGSNTPAIDIDGGSGGIKRVSFHGLCCNLRPSAGTHDIGRIKGKVNIIVDDTQALKQDGAGAARDVWRLDSDYVGSAVINSVQSDGLSGHCLTAVTGITASTARIIGRDLQNLTTEANRVSDADGIVLVDVAPSLGGVKAADLASVAGTTDLSAVRGDFVDITGTNGITGLGTERKGRRVCCRFTGALTMTHNATSLILPGGVNRTTTAGTIAEFLSLGSGNWVCTSWMNGDDALLAGGEGASGHRAALIRGIRPVLSMTDDSAISSDAIASGTSGLLILTLTSGEYLLAQFETSGTATLTSISAHANINVTTGALTGTTGTDAKFNVAIHTDRKIYFENRLGATTVLTAFLMSSL